MGNGTKLLVFDVDGTLAPHGMPMERETAQALCELERRGHTVAFASGKPSEYLDGLARGIGLMDRCMIAENGGVIFYRGMIHLMAKRPEFFERLHSDIVRLFPQARLQHNMVNLTALATGETLGAVVNHLQDAGVCDGKSCGYYLHSDSAELLLPGVNKGSALHELKAMAGFSTENTIVAGNAENDVPMRGEAGLFLAVGDGIEADSRFSDTKALISSLLDFCI